MFLKDQADHLKQAYKHQYAFIDSFSGGVFGDSETWEKTDESLILKKYRLRAHCWSNWLHGDKQTLKGDNFLQAAAVLCTCIPKCWSPSASADTFFGLWTTKIRQVSCSHQRKDKAQFILLKDLMGASHDPLRPTMFCHPEFVLPGWPYLVKLTAGD